MYVSCCRATPLGTAPKKEAMSRNLDASIAEIAEQASLISGPTARVGNEADADAEARVSADGGASVSASCWFST